MERERWRRDYSAEELGRIYQQMRTETLLVPMKPELGSAPGIGPRIFPFALYSEMGLEPTDPEIAYWEALQRANVIDGIGEVSWINAYLSQGQFTDQQIHRDMMIRFVAPELLHRITSRDLDGAVFVVFNRIGCLLMIRHLILFGGVTPQGWNAHEVGRLALLANDFVQNTPTPPPSPSNLDLLLLMTPTWDVYNVRNLGHAMSRMYAILMELLPGSDPMVSNLVSQLGIVPGQIDIDGIPLDQFAALVFGLFAFGRPPQPPPRVLFNVKEIFAQTNLSQDILEKFWNARARTLDEFRALLSNGNPVSRSSFSDELKRRPFLIDSLNLFRRYPFLRLDSKQILILDVQFVAELLITGVYWSIHDGLPREKRETFKQLWGRMFELYTTNLLAEHYPPMSGMFSKDIEYSDGQIDALLDFGRYVLLIEIKSSLLTEPAKRNADKDGFLVDFHRKFVENDRRKPKAIKQLATACQAILAGDVETANAGGVPIIYPIFISDEPAIEALFMNTFFNEEFQKEGIVDPKVKPLTIMSIDELEQVLSHVPDNDFSWEELLQSRFREQVVSHSSVGQAIYDLIVTKGLTAKQNTALKLKYDKFTEMMRPIYQKP